MSTTKNSLPGVFISVEGHDGAGKTVQIAFLADYLREKGFKVIQTRDPGGTEVGEKLREILLFDDLTSKAELLLFATIREQLIHQLILPHLQEGWVVISDRFSDSTHAYQGYGHGLQDEVKELEAFTKWIVPDHTLFFSIPLIESIDRITRRSETVTADRFDQDTLDFKSRVYDGYNEIAKEHPHRIITINASPSIEIVSSYVKTWLDGFFIPTYSQLLK